MGILLEGDDVGDFSSVVSALLSSFSSSSRVISSISVQALSTRSSSLAPLPPGDKRWFFIAGARSFLGANPWTTRRRGPSLRRVSVFISLTGVICGTP